MSEPSIASVAEQRPDLSCGMAVVNSPTASTASPWHLVANGASAVLLFQHAVEIFNGNSIHFCVSARVVGACQFSLAVLARIFQATCADAILDV